MVRDRQQQPQVVPAEGRTGPAIIHAHYAQRFSLPQQRGIHTRGDVPLRDAQIRFATLPDKALALLHGAARQRHADGWFAGWLMSFQQKLSCFWLFDEQRAPGRSRNDGHHLLHDGLKKHIQAPFLAQLQGKFVQQRQTPVGVGGAGIGRGKRPCGSVHRVRNFFRRLVARRRGGQGSGRIRLFSGDINLEGRLAYQDRVGGLEPPLAFPFDLFAADLRAARAAEVFDPILPLLQPDASMQPRHGHVRRQVEINGDLFLPAADDDLRRLPLEDPLLALKGIEDANRHGSVAQ